MQLVEKQGNNLQKLDEKFKSQKRVVLAAIKQKPQSFQYASHTLKESFEVVLCAVSLDGL